MSPQCARPVGDHSRWPVLRDDASGEVACPALASPGI